MKVEGKFQKLQFVQDQGMGNQHSTAQPMNPETAQWLADTAPEMLDEETLALLRTTQE